MHPKRYNFIDRPYDMQRGQFTQIDKKADKYYEISPYAYSLNNPISFIDPDGKDPIHFSKLSYTGGWTDYLKTIPNAIVSVGQGVMDMTWNSADANVQSLQRGTWLQDMGNEISSMPGAAQQYVSNSVDYATSTAFTQQIKDAVSPQAVESMLSFTAVMAVGSGKLPEANVGFSKAAAAEGGLNVASKGGTPALEGAVKSNYDRFVSKMPANAKSSASFQLLDKNSYLFQATSPGKVPGSSALYQKWVNTQGETFKMTKTTFAPDGSIIHVKPKL
jgi:hypothetical protein